MAGEARASHQTPRGQARNGGLRYTPEGLYGTLRREKGFQHGHTTIPLDWR